MLRGRQSRVKAYVWQIRYLNYQAPEARLNKMPPLALRDPFGAAHIRPQHGGNRNATILVLVVLHHRYQSAGKPESRTIEGMHQLRLAAFFPEPNLRATRLKIGKVRARGNPQPLGDTRRPHLDVVFARRRKSQVAGAHLNHTKWNLQAAANLACILDQLFELGIRGRRMHQLDHLDFVKLMTALDAAHVAPGGHFLAPKTRRIRGQVNRQSIGVEYLARIHTGQRHLGGWDKPEILLLVAIHRVLELRQMCAADHRRGIHHQGRRDFEITLLLGLHVEHPRDQRTLEPRTRAEQKMKSSAGDFYSALEIDNAQRLAELPMRFGFERGKLLRRALASRDFVFAFILADRN